LRQGVAAVDDEAGHQEHGGGRQGEQDDHLTALALAPLREALHRISPQLMTIVAAPWRVTGPTIPEKPGVRAE
jgi:hypothetical protein